MDPKDSSDHRLVQVFLSKSTGNTLEVYWNIRSDTYVCTCPGFQVRDRCVHLDFVLSRVDARGGYPLAVDTGLELGANIADVMSDHRRFRTFVLENVKVEMVD